MSVYRPTVWRAAVLEMVWCVRPCHGRIGTPFGACCRQLATSLIGTDVCIVVYIP